MKKFYVYCLYVDGVARYIGTGSGLRAWNWPAQESNRGGKLRHAVANGGEVSIVLLANGLTRKDAFRREDEEKCRHPEEQLWSKRERWADPVWAAKRRADMKKERTPERNAKASASLKKRFHDPINGARMRAGIELGRGIEGLLRDPTVRKRQGRTLSKRLQEPEMQEKWRQAQKKRWTPERRERYAEKIRQSWQNPETRAKRNATIEAKRQQRKEVQ